MKIFCIMVLVVAFLMFYQNNPIYALVILMLVLGLYVFIKRRKNPRTAHGRKLFSLGAPMESGSDQLLKLIVMQQLLQPDSNRMEDSQEDETIQQIEEEKQFILGVLDEKFGKG